MEVLLIDVAASVILSSVLIWAWGVFNQVWLKPKRQETALRKQGLKGTSYKFPFGDLKKEVGMVKEAVSKPINLTDDISPRIVPFLMQTLKDHGNLSFSWLGPKPRVTITKPQQIKEVTSKVYDFQKPRPHPLGKLLASGVAVYDGEKWAKHRKIVTPAFHLEKLKKMVPAFYQSCGEMVTRWEKLVSGEGSSAEVDVLPHLVNLTADVISRTAFGSNYEEGRRIFQMQEEQGRLFIEAFRMLYIPGWRFLPTKGNRRMKEIDREVKAIIRGIINKREIQKQAGKAPADDLLGILLESNGRQDGEQQRGMTTEDVIEECRLFYLAGQETTSELLVWTMIMLGHHQDWQERARDEVLQTFGQKKPDFDGLGHLKVITMIINEVLRLYPPGPVLVREVHKEMKLGELVFPAGTQIAIPVILVHRDPELWGQDASEFKPERFSDGISKVTKNQVSYLPFGWGPRICVAQNFALSEAKVALSMILQKFRFELSPTYTHAPYTVLTLQPQFGAHLILHKL